MAEKDPKPETKAEVAAPETAPSPKESAPVAKKAPEATPKSGDAAVDPSVKASDNPGEDNAKATAELEAQKAALAAAKEGKPEEKPANPEEKPKTDSPEMAPGPGKDFYDKIKAAVGENPSPIGKIFLMLASLMAKFQGAFTEWGDGFDKSLDKGDLAKEKIGDVNKLKEKLKGQLSKEVDPKEYEKLGTEEASAKYVSQVLGIDPVAGNSLVLAAKLKHLDPSKDDLGYESTTLDNLQKKGVKKGTIVIFKTKMLGGQKIVAIATGNNDEFQYYNSSTNKVDRFFINQTEGDGKSPITSMNFVSAYEPMNKAESEVAKVDREKKEAEDREKAEKLKADPESPFKTMKEFDRARRLLRFSSLTFDKLSKKFSENAGKNKLLDFSLSMNRDSLFPYSIGSMHQVSALIKDSLVNYSGADKEAMNVKIDNGILEFENLMTELNEKAKTLPSLSHNLPPIPKDEEMSNFKALMAVNTEFFVMWDKEEPEIFGKIFKKTFEEIKSAYSIPFAKYIENAPPEFKALLEKYNLL